MKRRVFVHLVVLFVTCMIFDQTKDLFKRWLMYGIGTIFSMALLSVVASMVLGLTIRVSAALWGAKIINSIMGNSTEGLTSVAMQQGGIGLLLSILIVSVPPMAAMFFQGTLGSALTYSVFQGAGSKPGPQGQPAGSWSQRSLPPPEQQHTGQQPHSALGGFATRVAAPQGPAQQEAVKQDASRYTP
ncbi:type IV secretion system protein [Luteibacter sp. dw_328]|uniref:type IV secretion system protein n=1 Tax=Luteibacter sp. dw_328 TaxID=2719796 RepID=UPI001BD4AAC1|nr:type IV secretion system protein [Luteibacter sp. dw_328]